MTVLFWRRLDSTGLERFELAEAADGASAHGAIVTDLDGGAAIEHHWRLDRDWRAQLVILRRTGQVGDETLHLKRFGERWEVNGHARPDLDGAEEPDLSLTPFCNSLVIRRLPKTPGATLTLDTCYIDGAKLTVERSSQRYERIDARHVRYVDLGVAKGFEAVIRVDADDLVMHYEHLFERL